MIKVYTGSCTFPDWSDINLYKWKNKIISLKFTKPDNKNFKYDFESVKKLISLYLKKDSRDLEFVFLKNNSKFRSELLQLNLYFDKKIKNPVLNYLPIGTTFQKKVWLALNKIPYGKVKTYKEIAIEISSPKSSRAVGNACGKNNLPIVIPCHRVVGSNNSLGGFSAGTKKKKILLKLENENNINKLYF